MPHIIIEHSANPAALTDLAALVAAVQTMRIDRNHVRTHLAQSRRT